MIKYLISSLGTSTKINGVRIPKKIDDENKIIEKLKRDIKNYNNIVFVASYPENFEGNDIQARVTREGLALSGFSFKNSFVLDSRTKDKAKEIIEDADFVFLMGGLVPPQNQFFHEIKLAEILKNFNGVVAGQSSGAMNMADDVVNYPEEVEELNDPMFLKGLGITKINVIPHFEPVTGNVQVSPEIDLMTILKGYSKKYSLVCLVNGACVRICDEKAEIFGEAYLIKNQNLTKICETGKSIRYCESGLNK